MAMKVCYTVLNGRVVSENRNGVERSYSLDPLGNTRALYDSTLTKTDTFDYFPSGGVAVRTGTTPTPFQWNGGSGYYRDNSKRTHVRARNFNVNLGRWQEPDPIGFKGGDYNLYRYVNNRFVVRTDPSGLRLCDAIDKNLVVIPSLEGNCCTINGDSVTINCFKNVLYQPKYHCRPFEIPIPTLPVPIPIYFGALEVGMDGWNVYQTFTASELSWEFGDNDKIIDSYNLKLLNTEIYDACRDWPDKETCKPKPYCGGCGPFTCSGILPDFQHIDTATRDMTDRPGIKNQIVREGQYYKSTWKLSFKTFTGIMSKPKCPAWVKGQPPNEENKELSREQMATYSLDVSVDVDWRKERKIPMCTVK